MKDNEIIENQSKIILSVINHIISYKQKNRIEPSYVLLKDVYAELYKLSTEAYFFLYKKGIIEKGMTINDEWIKIREDGKTN